METNGEVGVPAIAGERRGAMDRLYVWYHAWYVPCLRSGWWE